MVTSVVRYAALLVVLVSGCRPARLAVAGLAQTLHPVRYDGQYYRIVYPGGDVPDSVGCCTDVIIRAYRKLGVDLQQKVHDDVVAAPGSYGISRPDPSIDHRRVPNLQTFFRRRGAALPASDRSSDYRVGDVVTWLVPTTKPGDLSGHIGIVVTPVLPVLRRPLICHNINGGPVVADVLFAYRITGHYRWHPR